MDALLVRINQCQHFWSVFFSIQRAETKKRVESIVKTLVELSDNKNRVFITLFSFNLQSNQCE